jgi:hypothetical protein
MVQFTPFETPKPNSSMGEYFGYTKEPGAIPSNKVASSILEGVSDFGSLAIKALDTTNKIRIDDELSSTIRGEKKHNTDVGLDLLSDLTKPQEQQYADVPLVTGPKVGGVVGQAVEPIPPSIEAGIDRMNKLNQATKQGKFDDIAYYGNMQQIAQNLISRYPGYAQYITDKTAHFVGTDPANAQRNAVQSTLAQLLNTKNAAADQWTKFVDSHAKYLGDEGAVRAAYNAVNDPVAQNNFRVQIGKSQATEHNIKLDDATLERELKTGKVTTQRAEGVVNSRLGDMVSTKLDTFLWNVGGRTGNMQDLRNIISRMQATGAPDPETLQMVGQAVGQLKDAFSKQSDEWYRTKQYGEQIGPDGNRYFTDSPSTVLKDAGKWADIKKSYMAMFDDIATQAGTGNLHLATTDAATIAAMGPNQAMRLVANPVFKNYMGIEAGLKQSASAVINQLEQTNNWQGRTKLVDYLTTLNAKAIVSGTDKWKGYMDSVNNYEKAAAGDPTSPPEVPVEFKRAIIDNNRKMVINPDMPLESRTKVAEYIANDQTLTFINTFKDKDRPNAWAAIYAPDVGNAIKTTMSVDTWQRYRSLGEQAFKEVFKSQIDILNKSAQTPDKPNFRWNEETQQIEPNEAKLYRNRVVKTEVDRTIDNINTSLRTASNMLAQDGEKITQEWLQKVGVNLEKTDTPADHALKPLRMAGISPSGLASPTARNRNNAPVTSPEAPRGTLNEFLAKKSTGDQTPIYEGDTLVKNPQDVYRNAVEYKGEYFVRKDNKWFKIILPTK